MFLMVGRSSECQQRYIELLKNKNDFLATKEKETFAKILPNLLNKQIIINYEI